MSRYQLAEMLPDELPRCLLDKLPDLLPDDCQILVVLAFVLATGLGGLFWRASQAACLGDVFSRRGCQMRCQMSCRNVCQTDCQIDCQTYARPSRFRRASRRSVSAIRLGVRFWRHVLAIRLGDPVRKSSRSTSTKNNKFSNRRNQTFCV